VDASVDHSEACNVAASFVRTRWITAGAPAASGPVGSERFSGLAPGRRDRGDETAAILMSVLAGAKRHGIEPFAHVGQLLIALSSADADLRSLLPDIWIAAHSENFLQYSRDEAEAAARARKRRRERPRAESKVRLTAG
jgi:hypothetical protein